MSGVITDMYCNTIEIALLWAHMGREIWAEMLQDSRFDEQFVPPSIGGNLANWGMQGNFELASHDNIIFLGYVGY